VRDWFGVAGGFCWGLALSRFFSSDGMTGLWLVILFGPPVVLLISSAHPFLSWQLPIVTAVIGAAFMNRNVDDSSIGTLADAALWWFLCSLLSWPWALMLHHRSRGGFADWERHREFRLPTLGWCCSSLFAVG